MFTVGVSDHILVAHSLPHPGFGPAQNLHGATYVVEVEVYSRTLDAMAVVLDIGQLKQELSEVLARMSYKNLDDLPEWRGALSTTEALCRHIHEALAGRLALGTPAAAAEMRVRLRESPNAWAAYQAPLGAPR